MKVKQQLNQFTAIYATSGVLMLTGCQTIDPTAAGAFATGVSAARTQVNTAFNAAASITREGEIGYVATQPTLNESDFIQTPTAEIIAAWDKTFSTVLKYAQDLDSLISPGGINAFDKAAGNLAESFKQTGATLTKQSLGSKDVDAGISTAFTEVANLILEAKAKKKARAVAEKTDPKIALIFNLLADEIGETQTNGLRGTLHATWVAQLARLSPPFLTATNNIDKKIRIADQYAEILDKRDAQDQSLAALRSSLIALRTAHHALAKGDAVSLRTAVALIVNEGERSAALYNQFKGQLK